MADFKSVAPLLVLLGFAGPALAQRGDVDVVRLKALPGARPGPRIAVPRHLITRPDLQAGSTTLPAIFLSGYWPPSNEGIREFSTDPIQNPGGWIGADWEGRGYDVYSFFPEFTPPDCFSCGTGTGDLEVDYQDTSADFFPLADSIDPIAIITFSRGFIDMSWELEMNQFNRSTWINDFVSPFMPTPNPPDASVPAGFLRPSTLPVNDIVSAISAAGLGLTPFVCFTGDGGGFLSEFMAYHGVWYQSLHASPTDPQWVVAAGHVHVGGNVSWPTAMLAVEVTLREVISHVDAVVGATVCQSDLGFAGPGSATLSVCGEPLTAGAQADLLLTGAPANTSTFLIAGFSSNPTPFPFGGTVVPFPAAVVLPVLTDSDGEILQTLTGGGTAATVYTQFAILDASTPFGVGLSNAVAVDFLP